MKPIFISQQLSEIDPDVYKVIVVIFIIVLIMWFVLKILRNMLNHKLKNRIIDKEIPQELASSILQTGSNNEIHNNQYLPLGLHSIGIMIVSIAVGFLTYSIYLKRFDK